MCIVSKVGDISLLSELYCKVGWDIRYLCRCKSSPINNATRNSVMRPCPENIIEFRREFPNHSYQIADPAIKCFRMYKLSQVCDMRLYWGSGELIFGTFGFSANNVSAGQKYWRDKTGESVAMSNYWGYLNAYCSFRILHSKRQV